MTSPFPSILPFDGVTPTVDPSAWIAPTALLIGDVTVAASASVFYGAVVRADTAPIALGEGSNLQDNVVVHADPGSPVAIGAGVSVGHGAVLHGCTIGDRTLIGMNATILNGASIGDECLVAAGALVLENTVIPNGSLVAGMPAKWRRELTADERGGVRANGERYLETMERHRLAQGGE
ncbi:gamma carbonic anhydrase family protein [Subtercola boreus]|uniref:Gamma carbonic anhydrase family protein n=1 Tax=Subtercola boreus TaxID=120213 RepID=A0A3E0W992_9MICO|nr:gamma carbonic anhydrase family protein [Subtercola boreus]RFA19780.1 gamma carbonic anhydrase family protein [Subtercola boreus]RFA19805.1 gamma carbonic anhydrase family protein [Subtercola boreus]RFA26200.1 gamma carbonic anhydrase family protein [Subtercola boreus]